MSLLETLRKDMLSATKEGNSEKVDILKLALASIINVQKASEEELKDADYEKILKKEVRKVKDSIEQFTAIGRTELAEREKKQLDFLEVYLPKELDLEEITKIVKGKIEEIKPQGMKEMGKVMAEVMKAVAGKADGNTVKDVVQKLLAEV